VRPVLEPLALAQGITDAEIAPPGDISPGLEKPEIGKTEHTGIYSSSGFDVLGALVRFLHAL
jgi:hypothetical protein